MTQKFLAEPCGTTPRNVALRPAEIRSDLPTVEQIEAELERLEAPPPPAPQPKKIGRKKKGGGE